MLNFKIIESQKLIFSKGTVVAADTTNLEAQFEVNDLFSGTLRAYWNVRGSAVDSFKVDLDESGMCLIPAEVLESISDPSMYGDIDHILKVSVVSIGEDDTARITSTTCEMPVYKSSYTGNVSQPSKPGGDGNITNIITGAALNGKQLDFYNGNNVIFSAPLDRLDSFLLPLLGGKMQGAINMDGHAITGIPDAVNDDDALALAFAKTLFAPSGYGLGTAKYIERSELDNTIKPGWNYWSGSDDIGDVVSNYWYMHVSAYGNGSVNCVQEIYPVLPSGHCKIVRRKHAGDWMPFEVENPPMVLGVEYRTTERWKGNPVFTMLMDCGSATDRMGIVYPDEVNSKITGVIRYAGKIGGAVVPSINMNDLNNEWSGHIAVGTNGAKVYCGSSLVGGKVYLQIWYTRSEA